MPSRRTRAARLATLTACAALLLAAPASASVYSDAVRADGPLHYLRLGDPPGARSAANSGILPVGYPLPTLPAGRFDLGGGAPALGVPGAIAGDPDTAAGFDGSRPTGAGAAPVAILDHDRWLDQQHFTWEAWVRPGRVDGTSRRVMASEEPSGGTLLAARDDGIVFSRYLSPGLWQMYSPTSHFAARVVDTVWGTLTAPLVPGRFNHVVATYDLVSPTVAPQGTMRLYVNGVLAAQRRSDFVPVLPRTSQFATLAIGSNTTGWLRYDGAIDEVAAYRRTLTAAEVAEHHRIGTTGR